MYKLWILYYGCIDVTEGIDANKTNKSKECNIYHYWFFFDKAFKFQRNVCNGCDDVLMISINVNQIAILNIKGAYYYCVINGINKSDAVNLLQNADLTKKKGVLKR